MAFNLGAFAGAAAQSGLSTYERLNEQAFKNLQKQQLEKEIAEKEALDQAWRTSQARVGQQDEYGQAIKTEGFAGSQQAQMLSNQGALPGNTAEDQAFERASAEAATGAMRENAVRQGAIPESQAALPELKPAEYTARQGMQDYMKAASQVSRKGSLEAIQMKSAMRASDLEDKFDTARSELDNTLARIKGTAESGGLRGLADAAEKEGLKVKFVEGKNGVGSRIQVLGPKGDVIETVSDIGSATKKLSQAAMQSFYDKSVSLLGSSEKVIAAMQGERTLAAKEAVIPSEIAKNMGAANYYNGKGAGASTGGVGGALYKKAEELAKDKTGKYFNQPEKAYEFLKRGFNRDEDKLAWDKVEVDLRKERATPQEIAEQRAGWFGPSRGYASPEAISVLQSGKDPKTGNTLTEKQLNEFNRKFPKTPWQDILGEDNMPQPPAVTQVGGKLVPPR